MSILDIQKKCFLYLINYKDTVDSSLLFMTRQRSYKERSLENGYFFLGNNDYVHISFWDSEDGKEKINSIGFVILNDGSSYIEISGRDDETKAIFLKNLIRYLEDKTKKNYKMIKQNKWISNYSDEDYIKNLESFISFEKVLIDLYIKSQEFSPVNFLTNNRYYKMINKIVINKNEIDDFSNILKKEGLLNVAGSDYTVHLLHNEVQNRLYISLKDSGQYIEVKMEKNYVDIIGYKEDGKIDYYEIKPYNARLAIRHALGQLLEYSHYPEESKAHNLFIVTCIEPAYEDYKYIKLLRNKYSLNIHLIYFNLVYNRIEGIN